MKTCKVKVNNIICNTCKEIQEELNSYSNCSECNFMNREYELIEIKHDFLDDYAIIQYKDNIKCIPLERIYDIKET